ncbi:MAG: hypothetical protein ABL977_10495 [Candidatus Eisenbacteria bacterium]
MPQQAKRIDRFLAPFRGVVLLLAVGYAVFAVVHDFQKYRGKVEVMVIAPASRANTRLYADGEFIARLPEVAAGDTALRTYVRMPGSWREVYLITAAGDTVHADSTSKGHFAMVDFDSMGLRERLVPMPD